MGWWVSITGRLLPIFAMVITATLLVGALLPAGRVVAFTTNPVRTREVYVMDLDRGIFHYFTTRAHGDQIPVWSPEARWIIYHNRSAQPGDLP